MRGFLIFFLSVAGLMAQGEPVPVPILSLEKSHHHFGKVGATGKVTHTFKVTNIGKGDAHPDSPKSELRLHFNSPRQGVLG